MRRSGFSWPWSSSCEKEPERIGLNLCNVSCTDAPVFKGTTVLQDGEDVSEDEQEDWFIDWTENPNVEKIVVRAFQWFNPDINVPPLSELLLLTQVLNNANILTVLAHLSKNIETIELPSMLE